MGTEPDSAKEQLTRSHFDAGGEIQGAVEGEEGRALTFFWSHGRDEGKEGKVNFGGNKKMGEGNPYHELKTMYLNIVVFPLICISEGFGEYIDFLRLNFQLVLIILFYSRYKNTSQMCDVRDLFPHF